MKFANVNREEVMPYYSVFQVALVAVVSHGDVTAPPCVDYPLNEAWNRSLSMMMI